MQSKQALVAIIMGSDSDWPVMKNAAQMLADFGVKYDAKVVSAHRTPDLMFAFAENAASDGYQVIIAGAGGAAHLPGMVAAKTTLPVLGVPVPSKHLQGQDSLLSIVQMPKGVPVAAVAIDNAFNAGLLAARMLSVDNTLLMKKTSLFQQKQKRKAQKMTRLMLKQLVK